MTPEFLYRLNYGPTTESDWSKVTSFLYDQYYGIEGRRRCKTMSSVCRPSWTSLLPWRRPAIRTVVEDFSDEGGFFDLIGRTEETVKKENWSDATAIEDHVLIGFLDPALATALLNKVYPGEDIENKKSNAYHDFVYSMKSRYGRHLLELELRLCRIGDPAEDKSDELSSEGETDDDDDDDDDYDAHIHLPFAAIVSDALELISHVHTQLFQKDRVDKNDIEINCRVLFESPNFYTSKRNSWTRTKMEPDFMKKQDRLAPAMAGLESLDLLDILLFSSRHPGPKLKLPKRYDPHGATYHATLRDAWLDALEFKTPNDEQEGLREKVDALGVGISNIDASFICSGPFRLMLTTRLENHMSLHENFLQVYWDFEETIGRGLDLLEGHFFWDRKGNAREYRPIIPKITKLD